MNQHPKERALERYGQNFKEWKLLATINEGRAKLVSFGREGTLVYDVPALAASSKVVVVRVIVPADKSRIITVVPPQTPGQMEHARRKPIREAVKKRKREFFRDFEDDDEEAVASL